MRVWCWHLLNNGPKTPPPPAHSHHGRIQTPPPPVALIIQGTIWAQTALHEIALGHLCSSRR